MLEYIDSKRRGTNIEPQRNSNIKHFGTLSTDDLLIFVDLVLRAIDDPARPLTTDPPIFRYIYSFHPTDPHAVVPVACRPTRPDLNPDAVMGAWWAAERAREAEGLPRKRAKPTTVWGHFREKVLVEYAAREVLGAKHRGGAVTRGICRGEIPSMAEQKHWKQAVLEEKAILGYDVLSPLMGEKWPVLGTSFKGTQPGLEQGDAGFNGV
ncbi:hypothetical protein EJ06DRAFT_573800 [Trichodelitschia bisporula]|uniref:Uncharacterized protein n=1 Tax=Trichodelitschia bisporula TaxID=703511 RepID=A0A6G1I1L4_9PEZI|nr:hypothetical protein EJ06DRAFT_573800 [Trichodelitschia bisporula]